VVVKIPKWQFEKFPGADDTLGPQMKSVGEVMAIGRTFKEALMKAWRSLETGKKTGTEMLEPRRLTQMLVTPRPERLSYIRYAFERAMSVREVARLTKIDPWFLHQLREITQAQKAIAQTTPKEMSAEQMRRLKRLGLSDERIANGVEARRPPRHPAGEGTARRAGNSPRLQACRHLCRRV
jgi:carbamoyl-phosphate synthase large subunit